MVVGKQNVGLPSIVVGVGNIYASEALYYSGIHPSRQAGRISRQRYQVLADEVEAMFEADFARADLMTGMEYEESSFPVRLAVRFARLFAPVL